MTAVVLNSGEALLPMSSPDQAKGSHHAAGMVSAIDQKYRFPEGSLQFELMGRRSDDAGFFRFGPVATCYARTTTGYRSPTADADLYNALPDLRTKPSTVLLPFNPDEAIDNLRLERYARHYRLHQWSRSRRVMRGAYYGLRPWMGVGARKHLQRLNLVGWPRIPFPHWPVDTSVEDLGEALILASMKAQGVERLPFIWFWPEGASSCVVMTHDVEGKQGYEFCSRLMDVDDSYQIKASFQIVPAGAYKVSEALLGEIRDRQFEVNIQDLNHDGYLFAERQEFIRRVHKINQYGRQYQASGFRAAILYRNVDWYYALDFSYDMSVPNVAHLDPQRGGCCTVMPYFIGDVLELPVTTVQDYALFHLLGDYSIGMWQRQVAVIAGKHGLISFIVHPDYVLDEQSMKVYRDLLAWLREAPSLEKAWFTRPGEIDQWWRARSKMRLVEQGGTWKIEGEGAERARLAFAVLAGDGIRYEFHGDDPTGRPCTARWSDVVS